MFRCTTPAGADLCFHGGVCSQAPDGSSFCACPPDGGFTADYSWLHLKNCAMPAQTYWVALVVSACVTVACFALLLSNFGSTRGNVRRAYAACFAVLLSLFFESLARFVEGGFFRGAIVCWLLFGASLLTLSFYQVVTVVIPVLSLRDQEKRQFYFSYMVYNSVVSIAMLCGFCALIAFARDENVDNFNTTGCAVFFSMIVLMCATVAVAEAAVKRIIAMLDSADIPKSATVGAAINDKRVVIKTKLEAVRDTNRKTIGVPFLITLTIPVVQLVLGSFPYFFCFLLAQDCVLVPVSVTLTTFAFARQHTNSSTTLATTSSGKSKA